MNELLGRMLQIEAKQPIRTLDFEDIHDLTKVLAEVLLTLSVLTIKRVENGLEFTHYPKLAGIGLDSRYELIDQPIKGGR